MTANSTAPVRPRPSIWGPLRERPFGALWLSGGIFFIGNAMHNMAASWLMIELTGSSFLAALVQTASFLPMFRERLAFPPCLSRIGA